MAPQGIDEGRASTLLRQERRRLNEPPAGSIYNSKASGDRVYGSDTRDLLAFVNRAQRLGFTLREIKEIVSIQ